MRAAKPEVTISVASAIVAACAMIATVWQGCEMRTHNRLSVRPLLSLNVGSHDGIYGIEVRNDGHGVAIIEDFFMSMEGTEPKRGQNMWRAAASSLDGSFRYRSSWMEPGMPLPAGHKFVAFGIPEAEIERFDSLQEQTDNLINSLEFVIRYRSLYGDVQTIRLRDVHLTNGEG